MTQTVQRLDPLKKSREDVQIVLRERLNKYADELKDHVAKGEWGYALQHCDWLKSLCTALHEVDSVRKW